MRDIIAPSIILFHFDLTKSIPKDTDFYTMNP